VLLGVQGCPAVASVVVRNVVCTLHENCGVLHEKGALAGAVVADSPLTTVIHTKVSDRVQPLGFRRRRQHN
jgi:hypothetical protein